MVARAAARTSTRTGAAALAARIVTPAGSDGALVTAAAQAGTATAASAISSTMATAVQDPRRDGMGGRFNRMARQVIRPGGGPRQWAEKSGGAGQRPAPPGNALEAPPLRTRSTSAAPRAPGRSRRLAPPPG